MKMNKQKWAVAVDFFQAITKGRIKEADADKDRIDFGGGIIWTKTKIASRQFQRSYMVHVNGKEFAIILTSPREKSVIDKSLSQIKINNNWLYTDQWIRTLATVLKRCHLEIHNVSRVDICLDGFGHFNHYKKYMDGQIKKVGRASTCEYFDGQRNFTGADIGSQRSDKYITLYNKSLELKKSNKDYIPEYWKKNGITGDNVERLELKLKNQEIKKYEWYNERTGEFEPFNWTKLDCPVYLASLLRTGLKTIYEFYMPDKCISNVTRQKKKGLVNYIDWKSISAIYLHKKIPKKSNEVYRLKLNIKTMFWIYLEKGDKYGRVYLKMAEKMAASINALKWFFDKEDFWRLEYVKGKKSGRFEYLPNIENSAPREQVQIHEKIEMFTI